MVRHSLECKFRGKGKNIIEILILTFSLIYRSIKEHRIIVTIRLMILIALIKMIKFEDSHID